MQQTAMVVSLKATASSKLNCLFVTWTGVCLRLPCMRGLGFAIGITTGLTAMWHHLSASQSSLQQYQGTTASAQQLPPSCQPLEMSTTCRDCSSGHRPASWRQAGCTTGLRHLKKHLDAAFTACDGANDLRLGLAAGRVPSRPLHSPEAGQLGALSFIELKT